MLNRLIVGRIAMVGVLAAGSLAGVPAFAEAAATDAGLKTLARYASFPWSRTANDSEFFFQAPGLCEEYPEGSRRADLLRRDFALLQDLGVKHFRVGVGWDAVEPDEGKFDWTFWDELVKMADEHDIVLLPFVMYTPEWAGVEGDYYNFWRNPPVDLNAFGEFMQVIASRYRDSIHSWELWTEPDNLDYWRGSVAEFSIMTKEAVRQIRRADPDALTVFGGLTWSNPEFFLELSRDYDILDYFDVVNLHGYYETWRPEPGEEYPGFFYEMSKIVSDFGATADLWLAEFGYSNFRMDGHQVSESTRYGYDYEHTLDYQAVALWKHHVLSLVPEKLSLMSWFRLHDLPGEEKVIGDANNRFLGLIDVKENKKPAYHAFKFFNQVFDQPYRTMELDGVEATLVEPEDPAPWRQVHAFELEDGTVVVAGWLQTFRRQRGEPEGPEGGVADTRRTTVNIDLPIDGEVSAKAYNALGEAAATHPTVENGVIEGVDLRGDAIAIILLER